jgi:DNA-binding HxlR family transcriptional regulator
LKQGSLQLTEECRRVSAILSRVGDKWTVLVVRQLGAGPRRFSEVRRALGSISQKMLTTTLRALERDGFVSRTVFPTVPPKVEYELTALGVDLLKPVGALGQWAQLNAERVEAAQRRYDDAPRGRKQPRHATSRGVRHMPTATSVGGPARLRNKRSQSDGDY